MKIYLPGKSNKQIPDMECLSWFEDHEKNIQQVLKLITPQTDFFAKSYGATILLYALQRTTTQPKNITMFGISRKLFKQFKKIPKETTIFQKTNDPKTSYEEVKQQYPNNKIIEVPGEDHNYDIIELIKN